MSRLSPIITPFRWYDKYYQQNRFEKDCAEVCEFDLITDNRHLLPFQFKRAMSAFDISTWVLRRSCDEPQTKILNEANSRFIEDVMTWTQDGAWTHDCGNMAIVPATGFVSNDICITGLTIGKTYTVNFTIFEFYDAPGGAALALQIKNGATVLSSYTSSGVKSYTFTATATNFCFSFVNSFSLNDKIIIGEVQIYQAFEVGANDVELDETLLTLFNVGDYDYIMYCGADLGQIPPGKYYSIMQDEGGNLYYSEVITVMEFVPEKSPYLILEWYNQCDIQDVVYQSVSGCAYRNKLYLSDAVLTKPEYPFDQRMEKDGNNQDHPVFQLWRKTISLIVGKCPEFLCDALTAIQLHDTKQYYEQLRIGQNTIDAAVEIESLEHTLDPIINDCMTKVDLKLSLADQFVDETCCSNNTLTACYTCGTVGETGNIIIPEVNVFDLDYDYALAISYVPGPGGDPHDDGLYSNVDGEWVLNDTVLVVCNETTGRYNAYIEGQGWKDVPQIVSVAYAGSGLLYNISGFIIPNTFAEIEYSPDGGSTWYQATPKLTAAQLQAGAQITLTVTSCCQYTFRIHNYTLNCNYGYSANATAGSPDTSCC